MKIAEPKRSEEASALMWVLLGHFADQLHWPVNGKLIKLSPEEWKEITTAAFNQEHVRLAAGLNGGVVMLGERTSKFGKKRMSEFIEFLMATGVERGVEFSEMAAA